MASARRARASSSAAGVTAAAASRRATRRAHAASAWPRSPFAWRAVSTRLARACVLALVAILVLASWSASGRPPRAPPTTSRRRPPPSQPVGAPAAGASAARPPCRRTAAPRAPPGAGRVAPSPGQPTLASQAPPKRFAKLRQASLLHKYQLGIAVLPGVGFRGIAPYEDGINCGQQAKRVCTGMLPFFIDVQPSFGFAEHWDVLVDLRFGIDSDFTRSRQFAIAPGVRYWVDPELPFKFFATIQGVFDATAQSDPRLQDNDFGVRNSNGFMFEVMRNLGVYVQFGETLAFRRWLRFEIDGGVGVQARIP